MPSDRAHELRQWAFGDNARSAAIELLLRADLANQTHPWVVHDRAWDTWAIDFDTLTMHLNGLAADHRAWSLTPSRLAVLHIAAALADDVPLKLRALLPALEYEHTELVMIAIAHSAGYTRFTATTDTTGHASFPPRPPLASWPE
jgi:hypothetical protein